MSYGPWYDDDGDETLMISMIMMKMFAATVRLPAIIWFPAAAALTRVNRPDYSSFPIFNNVVDQNTNASSFIWYTVPFQYSVH